MKNTIIATINNVEITIAQDSQSTLIPIRPICDALNIDYSTQLQKLKSDEDLASVVGLSPTTGADGKSYEMVCLPLEYIFGWLFTINPANVKPEARETVREYRRECYHALYEHFFNKGQERERSFERTITLQREQAELRAKPYKTGEDFERFLAIENRLKKERYIRRSQTSSSLISLKKSNNA